jgi:hypothetical protein
MLAGHLGQRSERNPFHRIEELSKSVRNSVEVELAFDSGACYPATAFESTTIRRVYGWVVVTADLNSLFSRENRHPQRRK